MPGNESYSSFMDVVNKIVAKEGTSGLFKGLVPCYLKVIPMTALLFMTNEWLKKYLKV